MKLELIIAQLRAYCPSFDSRVVGAAEFAGLKEATALLSPSAFVLPVDDSPGETMAQNAVRIPLAETFAVIVALDNRADERGQASAKGVHEIRAELWAALLGWRPEKRYDGVTYEGGNLLEVDRARLWWRFEFSAYTEIEPEDGFEKRALADLPHFHGLDVKVDLIDPAVDPNVSYPGPDGRIEHAFKVPPTGNLP